MTTMSAGVDARRDAFLAALETGISVSGAAAATRVARATAYRWRKDDPDFARRWDDALDCGADLLEDEALRRVKEGTARPVFYKGKQVGEIRQYNDRLLMFLLQAKRPHLFRPPAATSDKRGTSGVAEPDMTASHRPDSYQEDTAVQVSHVSHAAGDTADRSRVVERDGATVQVSRVSRAADGAPDQLPAGHDCLTSRVSSEGRTPSLPAPMPASNAAAQMSHLSRSLLSGTCLSPLVVEFAASARAPWFDAGRCAPAPRSSW